MGLRPRVSLICHRAPSWTTRQHSIITFCDAQITPVQSVRNLGVLMDASLSFLQHVNHVVSSGFYHQSEINQEHN